MVSLEYADDHLTKDGSFMYKMAIDVDFAILLS